MDRKVPRILMVDDLADNLFALELTLRDEAYTLEKALSAEEGLRKALKHDYSMFLLDVQMPGMNGFEMAELLKGNKRTSEVPIIFLTAISKDRQFVEKGFESGAVDYISKPVDELNLKLKIKTMLKLFQQQQELKSARKELMKLNLNLEKMVEKRTKELNKKNKELETFFYKLSHDLQGPLATVEGLVDLALAEIKNPFSNDYLGMIRNSNNRLRHILRKMTELNYINRKELKPERLGLATLTKELMKEYEAEIKSFNISVKITDNSKSQITADRLLTALIIGNLLENAITHQNLERKDSRVEIEITPDAGNLIYEVTDNGLGIAEDFQQKVFEMFYRAHQKTMGAGLGLYLVSTAIKRLAWDISIKSVEGEGTSVRISIPTDRVIHPTPDSDNQFNKIASESVRANEV